MVARVAAEDLDDAHEGTNALVSYSIAKNVVDEESGQPLFTVDAGGALALGGNLLCLFELR